MTSMRALRAQPLPFVYRRSSSTERRLLKSWDEYSLLEAFLTLPAEKRSSTLPFIDQVRQVRYFEESRSALGSSAMKFSRARLEVSSKPSRLDERIRPFVTGSNLTSKDIDTWLKISVIDGTTPSESVVALESAILRLIALSSANNLRALMHYIAKYWQKGLYGQRPLVKVARDQAVALLRRALVVHVPTQYVQSYRQIVPQLGIPDFEKFERFVSSFHSYLEVNQPPLPALHVVDDALLQLLAKCGSIDATQKRLLQLLDEGRLPSGETLDEFLASLSKHLDIQRDVYSGSATNFQDSVKVDLLAFRELLVSREATPAAIRFLLVWVNTLDEFYGVLDIALSSVNAPEIFAHCQSEMLGRIMSLSSGESNETSAMRDMAHSFAFLDRLKGLGGVKVSTLDTFLLLAARQGNAAGVYRILEMRDQLTADGSFEPLPSSVLSDLLDSFPLTNFPGSAVSTAQTVVRKLRTLVTPSLLPKYVGALQRSGAVVELKNEWMTICQTHDDVGGDALLAFIAAFVNAGETRQAMEVLEYTFGTEHRVTIVLGTVNHGLISAGDLYRALATSVSRGGWVASDVETLVGHIPGASQAMLTGDHHKIDELWPRAAT